jgi:peptidoglycan-associated lipoprotein
MQKTSVWISVALLVVGVLALGVSCAKRVPTEAEPVVLEEKTAQEQAAAQQAAAEAAARAQAEQERRLREQQAQQEARLRAEALKRAEEAELQAFEGTDIHFDFDKYVIKPEAMRILDDKAAWLRENTNVSVLIEGHCDERGTNEYNLALGERRANSAREYLVRAGVSEDRLSTVPYGEERPLCTAHNENCWWRNRRAHFVIR